MSHSEHAKTLFFLPFTPPATTTTHLRETGKNKAAQSKTTQQ
jgi:hypothetical protein